MHAAGHLAGGIQVREASRRFMFSPSANLDGCPRVVDMRRVLVARVGRELGHVWQEVQKASVGVCRLNSTEAMVAPSPITAFPSKGSRILLGRNFRTAAID
jgi:hypothetical protein